MADSGGAIVGDERLPSTPQIPTTLDEARSMARERFKTRLLNGEQIGGCSCHNEEEADAALANGGAPAAQVAGVRFRDSGRTYYFDAQRFPVQVGDWVVVETTRGREAGRVIIAPHQILLNRLQGELKPILRRLGDEDIRRMDALKREAANAVKTFGAKARERKLPMKPISAEYSFDGSKLTLNFSSPDRVDFRDLARDLGAVFGCRVELKQVGPRDEARLLGGLGRCGRTLCCSSWLPVYPEISMNMAKTQDLPLNPGKVSGVCGRLLCCLSYENEQYKQMKAVMPRLGQTIDTPGGPGLVVSLQVLKELVTVRLMSDNTEVVLASADLGFRKPEPPPPAPVVVEPVVAEAPVADADEESSEEPMPGDPTQPDGSVRRRRRRRGGKRRPQA